LQEPDIAKANRRIEIRDLGGVGELLIGELDFAATFISDRQQHHQLGRARLIIERLAQISHGRVELAAIRADRRTQLKSVDIAAVLLEDLGNQIPCRIGLLAAQVDLRKLDLAASACARGPPLPASVSRSCTASL